MVFRPMAWFPSLVLIHLSLLSEELGILPSLLTTGVFLGSGLTLQVQGLPSPATPGLKPPAVWMWEPEVSAPPGLKSQICPPHPKTFLKVDGHSR